MASALDYKNQSFWLASLEDDLTPRPALPCSTEVDVAILGGGFTGLWTAYYLLRASPGLSVAVAERAIVGFGASGRNGGWCSSKFPIGPDVLARRYGRESARTMMQAMNDAVDEIGRFCQEEQTDAHFHKGGMLILARCAPHEPELRAEAAAYARLGLGDQYRLLSAEETNEHLRVTQVRGALFASENASVHPGRLVRGLARAVERRGGMIYEQTPVTGFAATPSPRLLTPGGELRARRAVVLAGEAYLTELRPLRRCVLPLYSLISITEPLTAAQWARIGWDNRESVASARLTVDYLSRTADGRILLGSRGAPYRMGSRISADQERHGPTHARIHQMAAEWFPGLDAVKFTQDWGGAVGMPRDWMPMADFNPATRIASARGYTGQGVSTTNLAGRILTELILGRKSPLCELPMARRRSPNWECEPLRWLAVRYAQNALQRLDHARETARHSPWDAPLAKFIEKH